MIEDTASFLVIDDDDAFRTRLARAIAARGHKVFDSGCPETALGIVQSNLPSHIILDLRMPKRSGLETLRDIKKMSFESKVLILTGYGSIATAIEAVRNGAVNYLSKPTDIERIFKAFLPEPVKEPHIKTVPSLLRVEWEHIERVLHESGGNVSKTAKLLGLHRRSLQRKLRNPPKN